MANNDTVTRILDIQVRYKDALDHLASYRKTVEDAKQSQKDLKKQLDEGKISQAEYSRQVESTRMFIQQQNSAINTLSRQLQNQMKAEQEAAGSLTQWRAELSNLTAEYDRLSQAERESARGQELKDKINDVTSKLKEAEQATQRFYRNVGNYPGAMGGATVSAQELQKVMETQATTAGEAARQNEILKQVLATMDKSAAGAQEAMDAYNKKIEENNQIILEHETKSEGLIDSMGNLLGVNTKFGNSLKALSENSAGSVMEGLNVKAKALWSTLTGLLANPYVLAFLGIAAVGMAVKWWYDYNKGLVEATKLTQDFTGLTGDSMKAVRSEIIAVADTYDKDFKDVLNTADAMAAQFGISYEEALQNIKDGFIANGDAQGNMLQQLQQFAPAFQKAGISAKEFTSLVVQTKSGIFSTDGMNAIVKATQNIQRMPKATEDALKAIGVNTAQMQKQIKDGTITMMDAVQQVANKMGELPENSKEVGDAMLAVFGQKGPQANMAMIQSIAEVNTNLDDEKAKLGELGQLQEEQLNAQVELEQTLAAVFDTTGGWFETITAKAKLFITKGLINIIKGCVDIINYFIDLYNESILVRAAVQGLVLGFKNVWSAAKFMLNAVITGFKGLGAVVKSVFDFDITHPIDSWNRIKDAYSDGVNAMAGEWKAFTSEVVGNYEASIGSVLNDGNVQHISYELSVDENALSEVGSSGNDPSKSGGKGSGNSTKSDKKSGKTPEEEELELVRKAQDELLKLTNDAFEARRKQVASQYDREIGALKMRLLTEKDLTEEQKAEINARITTLESEKNTKIAEAEAEMLNGTKSAYNAQRQAIIYSYERQIADYQRKLDTDATLTQKSREAIQSMMVSLEQQKQQALDTLFQEQLKKDIEYRSQMIELELAAVKAGSDEEYRLKLEQLEAKRELDLNDATLTAEERAAIEAQYRKEAEDLEEEHLKNIYDKRQEALQAHFTAENEILKSQNEQKLAELEMMGASEAQLELQQLWNQYAEKQATVAQLTEELNNMKRENDESQTAFEKRQAAKRAEIAAAEVQTKLAQSKVLTSVYSSLTSAIDAMGEHSKAFVVMSKVLALAEIAINTGKAIAAGIAQAQSVSFPGNIVAIATTVATIIANVASAISTVKSAKFAKGGKVNGPGTGTSDSIPAQLSNGEFVMTARATRLFEPLLSAMNAIGSGVPIQVANSYRSGETTESLTEGFKEAAKEIKPVVSVVEITEAQDRVTMIENLDTY